MRTPAGEVTIRCSTLVYVSALHKSSAAWREFQWQSAIWL